MSPELLVLLQEELKKPEYDNKSPTEILGTLHSISEQVVGKIRGDDKLHLVDILARGLRKRIRDCQHEGLKDAFTEALEPSYLAAQAYSINVSLPEIRGMLDNGLLSGVVLQGEYDKIISLATYTKKKFESVTLKDVIEIVQPELMGVGEWQELAVTNQRRLVINSQQHATASPLIHLQVKESHNGTDWTEWRDFMRVAVPVGLSYQPIIQSNLQRRFRWRGDEYKLNATVEAI